MSSGLHDAALLLDDPGYAYQAYIMDGAECVWSAISTGGCWAVDINSLLNRGLEEGSAGAIGRNETE